MQRERTGFITASILCCTFTVFVLHREEIQNLLEVLYDRCDGHGKCEASAVDAKVKGSKVGRHILVCEVICIFILITIQIINCKGLGFRYFL